MIPGGDEILGSFRVGLRRDPRRKITERDSAQRRRDRRLVLHYTELFSKVGAIFADEFEE